jgi:hypothetical protein
MPLTTVNPALLDTQAQYTGFMNRIINGAMVIDQRNNGASVTLNNAFLYTLDRWGADEQTDGAFTVQQSSVAPAGFTNSLLVTTTTADSSLGASQYAYLLQAIEGFNCADLGFGTANASTVTLSFWVRSSLTGTFGGAIRNYGSNRGYPFTYTISSANTWEYKTITVAGDTTGTWLTNNSGGLVLALGLGVGSSFSATAGSWTAGNILSATGATNVLGTLNATWQITGVQLEKGSTATSFDYRPFGAELVLCERYFEKSFNYETAPAHNTGGLPVVPVGSNLGCGGNAYWTIPLKTCKRINNYTVRWYDPLGAHPASENWVRYITACDTGTAAGPNSNMVINSLTTNHIAGHSQVGTGVPPIIYWTADAEL